DVFFNGDAPRGLADSARDSSARWLASRPDPGRPGAHRGSRVGSRRALLRHARDDSLLEY
ncbi:hypothetical protein T492DRAFT_1097360, partial [Pavlovales sp. CCMP2436]